MNWTLAPILTPITTQQKVTYKTSNKKVCTVSKKACSQRRKKELPRLRYNQVQKKWL